MIATRTWIIATLAGLTLAVVAAPGCGDGVIRLGGSTNDGGGNDIIVEGDIASVFQDNALRDIVVFVYTDISADVRVPEDLACLTADDFTALRTVVVGALDGSASITFRIENVRRGDLTLVFLQDHASEPDGQIDEEDVNGGPADCNACTPESCPINVVDNAVAVLDDEGRLDTVRAGQTVDIQTIDIDFPTAAATATRIEISTTPPDNSGASASSSSSATAGAGLTIGFISR